MVIPFTSLRYGREEIQSWVFNFERAVRRNNELAYWSPLPWQYGLNRLSLARSVSGIDVPAQQNFVVTPYALSKSVRPDGNSEQDFGFDLKYSITPSLTPTIPISPRLKWTDRRLTSTDSVCFSWKSDLSFREMPASSRSALAIHGCFFLTNWYWTQW